MYFLPYNRLRGYSTTQIKALIESLGLPSAGDFVMQDERGVDETGVLIEKEDLSYLLDVFMCNRARGTVEMTEFDRWLSLTTTPIGPELKKITRTFETPQANSWRGGGSILVDPVSTAGAEMLDNMELNASGVGTTISDQVGPHGCFSNAQRGYLNIAVGGRPYNARTSRTVKLPETVFGVAVPFRPMGYPAVTSEHVLNITDGETVIAQYYPSGVGGGQYEDVKLLNILFPINWNSVPQFQQLLARIIDQLTRLTTTSGNVLDLDQLVRIKMATTRQTQRHLERATSQLESRVQSLASEYYAAGKELNDKKAQLTVYKAGIADPSVFKETAGRELEMIKAIPAITKMTVDSSGKKVVFNTEELHCLNPKTKKTHIIGRFRITINMEANGLDDAITWRNLDRRGSDQHHAPHVNSSGRACLGNMTEMLPEVLASGDIGVIALLAIQFIQSVNIDDPWGRKIASFPVIETAATAEGAVATVAA
jgi:hypothetical protein